MSMHRYALPQIGSNIFLTDVGLETMLVFHDGMELPAFAAFTLLDTRDGTERLRRYYRHCLDHATRLGCGFVLEAPTWRASADWGTQLGYTPAGLANRNARAIALMAELRDEYAHTGLPIVISGNLGPRADAYDPAQVDAADDYERYHRTQIEQFAGTAVDFVSAFTITNVPEAIGITRGRRARSACRWSSRSRSKRTGACRPGSAFARPSRRSTTRPRRHPPTT